MLKRILYLKSLEALKYLNKQKNTVFDLILIKQTIHFFSKKNLKSSSKSC